ncbi:hypothetical protein SLEP1_g54307 [Rubroshorea leprosula]|uniref:Disease resistance protein At4g27190-like leucine-rich repeats domain-containing protein n=1 Tax=Rubroshorea leprosula TaxID=152421 RepID=A0AAV5MCX6_9ROSI|nr:hypothetical protein SLEP1_g54307 [Rubroshorea leprosula]
MVLKISDCKMMEEVIKVEERMCEISFPELDTLELEDLPKLTRFYPGNSNATISERLPVTSIENVENTYTPSLFHEKVEFPKLKLLRLSSINIQQIWDLLTPKILSSTQNSKISLPIQNLKKLFVEGCGKVKYLLTSSMVISFNQLEWLKICDCEMMEAVIDSEESEEETISFPELHTLELINLYKLTRFYHAENTDTPFLFDEKVGFPKLKFLSLSSVDNLKYLLMSSMVKSFNQLMVLKICDCKMMEQVIVSNEVVEEMMCESFFSKLDTLELEDLPKLVRLCHGNYSKFKFSMLRRFTISKCAVLKTLIGNNAVSSENVKNTYTPSLFDEKVELPRLERVIIKFMGNWSKIWDDKHDVNSCSQLNSLTLDSCEKLLNIFPFSMLERVRQKLDTLEIQNCDSLEEIFGASQPQAQIPTQPTNSVEIVPMFLFPELTHINLSKLPKLKGFVPQIHINEWPSLKQLRVHGCDEVQIFASELPSFLGINEHDKLQIQLISKRIFLYKRSGRICHMLPARHLVIWEGDHPDYWRWFKPDPRFPEVAELLSTDSFEIRGRINTRMLSPKTRYKAYLVFKLADKPIGFQNKPIEAAVLLGGAEVSKRVVYVQAEGGIVGNGDQYPKERGDNWFEVELGEIEFTKERGGDLEINLQQKSYDEKNGVIIQGMEIRPT